MEEFYNNGKVSISAVSFEEYDKFMEENDNLIHQLNQALKFGKNSYALLQEENKRLTTEKKELLEEKADWFKKYSNIRMEDIDRLFKKVKGENK